MRDWLGYIKAIAALGIGLSLAAIAWKMVQDPKPIPPAPIMGYGIIFADPKRPPQWVEGVGFQWPSKDCVTVFSKKGNELTQEWQSCGVMTVQRMQKPEGGK